MSGQTTPAGWYPDPQHPAQQRYWDGNAWSEATQPLAGGAPAPAYGEQVGYGYAQGAGLTPAGAGARFAAYLIDGLIFLAAFIAVFVLWLILSAIADALGLIFFILGYPAVIGGAIWYILSYEGGPTGQTIGKKQMKIRVVDATTGQPGIGMGRAFTRRFWQWLWSIPCYYGYWSIFTNPERITQYDKSSKTRVVKA